MDYMAIRNILAAIGICLLTSCDTNEVIEYQGYIDGDRTFIASPFSGVIVNLDVEEGDSVKKDQFLVQLELEPQQSQYKQVSFELKSAKKTLDNLEKGQRQTIISGIEAELAKAKSELKLAETRLNRSITLFSKKIIDKDALDQATTERNTKFDTVTQLEAKLEESKLGSREDVILAQQALVNAGQARVDELAWALDSKKLSAPNSGYIYDIFYRQGEFVPSSKPILSLLTPSNQYIVFFVPLKIMESIKTQNEVMIDCEGCQKRYKASISYISPNVEYTPPVIFSRLNQDKYVYKLHAKLKDEDILKFHLGQPVYVTLVQNS